MTQSEPQPHKIDNSPSAEQYAPTRDSASQREPARDETDGVTGSDVPRLGDETARASTRQPALARADSHDRLTDIEPEERFTLNTKQVAEKLDEVGVQRSESAIRKYFRLGKIKAREIEGMYGKEWLANEIDTLRFANSLKDLELGRRASRGVTAEPDLSTGLASIERNEPAPAEAPIEDIAEQVQNDDPIEPHVSFTETDVDLRIEHASLRAENTQLKERLDEQKDQNQFLRSQVKEANEAARRSSEEAHQYKALLAKQNDLFLPLVEEASRRSSIELNHSPTPTAPLFENDAEVEDTEEQES